jgi:hypothetical protein
MDWSGAYAVRRSPLLVRVDKRTLHTYILVVKSYPTRLTNKPSRALFCVNDPGGAKQWLIPPALLSRAG